MHLSRRVLLLIILLLPLAGLATAQEDTTSPLFELLATVPNMAPDNLSLIYYADVAVAERARMGNANMITTAAQFEQLDATGLDMVWFWGYPSSTALPSSQYFMQGIPLYKEMMGFELFDIEQTLYFGNPPEVGYILKGNFDQDAIIEAYQARDYTLEEISGLPLLCGPAGCENGTQIDFDRRNFGNLFGGELGLSEPAALADGLIFDSRILDRLNAIVDAYLGSDNNILANDAYAASARALSQTGELRQAIFVPFNQLPSVADLATVLGPNVTDEQRAVIEEHLGRNDRDPSEMLPLYEIMTLGDITLPDEGVSHAVVTMAYSNPGFAENAAEILQQRIDNFDELQSLAIARSFAEVFANRGAQPLPVSVYNDEETGYAIVIATWETPLVVGTQEDENGRLTMSGMTFRLLVDMIYRRDMMWAIPG